MRVPNEILHGCSCSNLLMLSFLSKHCRPAMTRPSYHELCHYTNDVTPLQAHYKVDVDSDDCMALNPTNPAARKMVSTLLQECAALEGPTSPWLHLGGDEVKYPCWDSDPQIRAWVNKTYGDTSSESYVALVFLLDVVWDRGTRTRRVTLT
jgi:hypothetical protein